MYGIIYKIINCVNGKIYIGQTKHSLKQRWYYHCYYAKTNINLTVLQKAILKYGRNNFKLEIIDTADSKEDLDSKEKNWIQKLKSLVPNGYNLTAGGGGGCSFGKHNPNYGKKWSIEKRKEFGEKRKGKANPYFGKKRTKDENMKAGLKIKASWHNRNFIICPHCGLQSKNASNMKRWHFENCKYKKD